MRRLAPGATHPRGSHQLQASGAGVKNAHASGSSSVMRRCVNGAAFIGSGQARCNHYGNYFRENCLNSGPDEGAPRWSTKI